ncbi:hypothetical protein [Maribacter sp. 2-571]|uniref:hypothetical protein n=1 Tax=Maribacter sp. 2-571 TaxID=3417569 RepID=UPI003D358853
MCEYLKIGLKNDAEVGLGTLEHKQTVFWGPFLMTHVLISKLPSVVDGSYNFSGKIGYSSKDTAISFFGQRSIGPIGFP